MPILRPPHKSYTVVFEEGLPGDWLGWFINKLKLRNNLDLIVLCYILYNLSTIVFYFSRNIPLIVFLLTFYPIFF